MFHLLFLFLGLKNNHIQGAGHASRNFHFPLLPVSAPLLILKISLTKRRGGGNCPLVHRGSSDSWPNLLSWHPLQKIRSTVQARTLALQRPTFQIGVFAIPVFNRGKTTYRRRAHLCLKN